MYNTTYLETRQVGHTSCFEYTYTNTEKTSRISWAL